MNPRGRLNLVMGLLAAAALAFGVWRWRQQADNAAISAQITNRLAQAQIETSRHNEPVASREGRALPAQQTDASSNLPPWGRPLSANFDALRQRADAGDARAACRIGLELNLCAMSQQSQASTAMPHAVNVAPAGSAAHSGNEQSDQRAIASDNYCEGIDIALRNQAATYLRKAALAGNRDAMLRYAQGPFVNGTDAPAGQDRYLQDPAFADWYREALPTLHRALQAGDPRAAQLLANAYADDRGPLNALVPDDPAQAYTYRLLLSYLRKESPPGAGALDVRQRADAEHKAQRLYRESFGSQPIAGGVPLEVDFQPSSTGPAPCQ